jgi:hypothetical protein
MLRVLAGRDWTVEITVVAVQAHRSGGRGVAPPSLTGAQPASVFSRLRTAVTSGGRICRR